MTKEHPLDDLVEEMLPTAIEIAVCVRDRDTVHTHAALEPLLNGGERDRIAALIVALATMVPDDVPFAELVAWTHGPHVTPEEHAQIVDLIRPGHKRCARCREALPLEQFHKDPSRRDGRKTHCGMCEAEKRIAKLRQEGAA